MPDFNQDPPSLQQWKADLADGVSADPNIKRIIEQRRSKTPLEQAGEDQENKNKPMER